MGSSGDELVVDYVLFCLFERLQRVWEDTYLQGRGKG